MNYEDYEKLMVKEIERVLRPLKKPRILRKINDVGMDFEFDDKGLISIQLSLGRGKSKIIYWDRSKIKPEELLDLTIQFLEEMDKVVYKNIFCIGHYTQAEVSRVERWWEKPAKIQQFNSATKWTKKIGDCRLTILDTFGHFPMGLAKIGEKLEFPKFSLEGVGGKTETYWKKHMRELLKLYPAVFEKYSLTDAEIAIEAWNSLKAEYEPRGVDIHFYLTFASAAVAEYRINMTMFPCPVRKIAIEKHRKKGGEWKTYIEKKVVYDGLPLIRKLGALSYWGGNNQCFMPGRLYPAVAEYWDFISLYVIAGILQPLPNQFTRWNILKDLGRIRPYEGFARAVFKFPQGYLYPCLPVQTSYFQKLTFPSQGESYCTLREIKVALDQGAKILEFEGIGFIPGEREINHELRPVLLRMLKDKTEQEEKGLRGSVEYQANKLRMVGIFGRFAFRKPFYSIEDLQWYIGEMGLDLDTFRDVARKKQVREEYQRHRGQVGRTWEIEYAALVLGNARSYVAQVIPYDCVLISTDGGVWLGNPRFDLLPMHKEMQKYYSGIRKEADVDEIWSHRNRLYALWNKGKYVHAARGLGVRIDREDFAQIVRYGISQGYPFGKYFAYKRLSNAKVDFFQKGIPLNTEITEIRSASWKWDFKRKIQGYSALDIRNHSELFFTQAMKTEPYKTILDAYRDAQIFETGKIPERGHPTIAKEMQRKIRELRAKGMSYGEIAKKLDVSKSTVWKYAN